VGTGQQTETNMNQPTNGKPREIPEPIKFGLFTTTV